MEKREHPRCISSNLLAYVCLDKNDARVQQGMGKTLDVSEGGILLETHVPIEQEHTVLLTIGLKEDMVDVRGEVVYSRVGEKNRTQSGIRFVDLNGKAVETIAAFTENFRRNNPVKGESGQLF